MFASVHYQHTGPTPNETNIDGDAGGRGDGFIGFNSYCGRHITSSRATCSGCHVGNGQFPTREPTAAQLANIHCMMCHQIPSPNGGTFSIRVPVEDKNGFHYMPDEANMKISILEAARTVHKPTRSSCLCCHAGAAGRDGAKRGDLSSVTANPPVSSDVHMSPHGANLACVNCHDAGNHRVRGRGLDLRHNDSPDRLTCAQCHSERPHGDCHSQRGFDGGPARMNLRAELGYELKGPFNQVCGQCHRPFPSNGFKETHAKHVDDLRRDCSMCHNFSRPERGLRAGIVRKD